MSCKQFMKVIPRRNEERSCQAEATQNNSPPKGSAVRTPGHPRCTDTIERHGQRVDMTRKQHIGPTEGSYVNTCSLRTNFHRKEIRGLTMEQALVVLFVDSGEECTLE